MSPKAEASPIGATSHATGCSGVRVDLPCAPKGGRRLDADGNMIGHQGQAAAGSVSVRATFGKRDGVMTKVVAPAFVGTSREEVWRKC